jgi:hypothetical protein
MSELIIAFQRVKESDSDNVCHNFASISSDIPSVVPTPITTVFMFGGEVLPAAIVFVMGLALGGIADGFFKAVGTDAYKKAKESVINILKKETEKKPTLSFEMKYKNTNISISTKTNDEDTLNKVFDTIEKARDLAISELDKEKTPDMTELTIVFDNDWYPYLGKRKHGGLFIPLLDKSYKYNKETKKWKKG